MDKILIRPAGVLAQGEHDLDSLAVELGELASDLEVSVEPADRGRSFAFLAVLHVILPWVEGYIATKAIDAVLDWARCHVGQASADDRDPHSIDVKIYGSRGEVLKTVRVTAPDTTD